MSIRVRFDGHVLIPVDPVDLPKDRVLEVDVRAVEGDPEAGSPQALLRYLESLPPIPKEWVDELEQAIKDGERPARYDSPFPEDDKANG